MALEGGREEGRVGGREGRGMREGEGGREGRRGRGREGMREGGRDDCYTCSNIGMFNSNPMAPQYLNYNHVTYYTIT